MKEFNQTETLSSASNIEAMALHIAQEAPTLAHLNQAQLEHIAKMVIAQRLTNELNQKVDLATVNYENQKQTFLDDTKSVHTRRAYKSALYKLEAWANKHGKAVVAMNAEDGDNFIRSLKTSERANTSIRRDIAAVSAFFTFLERYYACIKNPIRGTRIRPENKTKNELGIPNLDDMAIIQAAVPPFEKAIIAVLAGRGLRAGALPTLERKKDGKYTGQSKGKTLNGKAGITLPQEALDAIEQAGIDMKKPFAFNRKGEPMTGNAIERRINYQIGKLYKTQKIKVAYSCHDFRHFYAVSEYQKNKDLYRISKLLNHAGVHVTETYLKSLGLAL